MVLRGGGGGRMLDADEAGGLFNNVEQLEGDVKALA